MSKMICLVTSLLLVSSWNCDAQIADFDPLEWLDADQALMLRIAEPELIREDISALAVWDHPELVGIREFLATERFQEMAEEFGVRWEISGNPAMQWEEIKHVLAGPLVISVQARPKRDGPWSWIAIVPTKLSKIGEFRDRFASLLGVHAEFFDEGQMRWETVKQDGLDGIRWPATGTALFLINGHLIAASEPAVAGKLIRQINSTVRPKRSFAESRKFAQSVLRAGKLSKTPALLQIYFDPSIAQTLFPTISSEIWRMLGLQEITASLVELRAQANTKVGRPEIQLSLDVWIAVTHPRCEIHDALLGGPPIDQIPDIEGLREGKFREIQAIQIDSPRLFTAVEEAVDSQFRNGMFQTILDGVERQARVPSGFVRMLSEAWDGRFVMLHPTRDENFPRGPIVFAVCCDEEKAVEIVQALVNSSRLPGGSVPDRETRQGVTTWVWSAAQTQQQRSHIEELQRASGMEAGNAVGDDHKPSGWSVSPNWMSIVDNDRVEEIGRCETFSVQDSGCLAAQVSGIRQRDSSIDAPFAIWSLGRDYWPPIIAGMEYRLNSRRFGPVRNQNELDRIRQPMEELALVPDFQGVLDQLQVRVAKALVDSAGQITVIASSEDFGLRISGNASSWGDD